MQQTRSSKRLLIVLVVAVVLLTLAGLGLLGAYLYLARQPRQAAGWVNPLNAAVPANVAPDLAVLTLAGEPDDRVAQAALDAGELETAYTTLAYAVLLPDSVRSGNWLLLARHYLATDPERSRVSNQAALDLSSLGPTLNDLARADVSLQVARDYTQLDQEWISRLALSQAENIARYSITLLPAQRRTILNQVAAAYRALGDIQQATGLEQKIDEYAAGPGVVVEASEPLIPTLRGSVTLSEPVLNAMAARQQAAAALAARWLSAGPSTRDTLSRALGEALLAEDAARADFYATAESLPLADRLAMLYDRATWLTIKYRAAQGGYGIAPVPQWETQVEEIASQLAETYTTLINGYGQQLDTLDAVQALQARVELLRQGLLWSRLGLFPGRAEQVLSEQLADASRQLWSRQGGVGLTVIGQDVEGQRFYLLSGSDAPQGQP